MTAVYSLCDGTEGCLVSPIDILSVMPSKTDITVEKLDEILTALSGDGYFELISSERKGEKMYVINLKTNAFKYRREAGQRRRDVAFRIFLALVGATATFVFGLILKGIFG